MELPNEKKQSGFNNLLNSIFYGVFSYSTSRYAKIDSITVAAIFRIAQIIILGYIIGFELVYKKGYQSFDPVSSTVTTKVKGFGFTNKDNVSKVFDTADYIIPPNEYNSIFVMTNYISTEQTRSVCEEDYNKVDTRCKEDSDCQNIVYNTWDGIPTGRCINSSKNATIKVCEVSAWCPVEDDSISKSIRINNVLNYTIFIKNDVEFKTFNRTERNILPNITNKYIATCTYQPIKDPYCPVFLVKDILEKAEKNSTERELMLKQGGVIQIVIRWNCNYDIYSIKCQPKYTFERFDLKFQQGSTASGFNFRYAEKYKVNGTYTRNLVKAFGLRFVIIVEGKAGKFSIVPLLLTVGAGLGLLSISTMVADCYMLNLSKKRKLYNKITLYAPDDEPCDENIKIWYSDQLTTVPSFTNSNYNNGLKNNS